jgi:hypothetical protein
MKSEIVSETQERVSTSPAEMIKDAIQGGADLDKLEKLLALQERWDANQARKAYHAAMAQFKANPPKISKDKKVGYQTEKGRVGYSHASLYNVCEKINKELSKYGLSASWTTHQNGQIVVTCKITHELGHSEETSLSASADTSGAKNPIQAIGSTITYLERYTLLALTGLATHDQDTDGFVEGKKIGDKEMHTIRDLLIDGDLKEAKLLEYMKVEKLEDILLSDYNKAINAVKVAKAKKEKAPKSENN